MRKAWLAALCLASGCGFRAGPLEPVSNEFSAVSSYGVAFYAVKAGEVGNVRVWSSGIRPQGLADADIVRTSSTTESIVATWKPGRVHVGFDIRNDQPSPVLFDARECALELNVRGGRALDLPPEDGRNRLIPPGTAVTASVYFRLPHDVQPQDITGYTVEWALTEKNRTYRQQTAFDRSGQNAAPDANLPFDPYFYGYPSYYLFAPARHIPAGVEFGGDESR